MTCHSMHCKHFPNGSHLPSSEPRSFSLTLTNYKQQYSTCSAVNQLPADSGSKCYMTKTQCFTLHQKMGDTHTPTHWPKMLSNKNTVPYIALVNGTHTHIHNNTKRGRYTRYQDSKHLHQDEHIRPSEMSNIPSGWTQAPSAPAGFYQ